MKIYTYQGCSTCKSATKWLKTRNIEFTEFPIRETPPDVSELSAMLKAKEGELLALFNTSGKDYRALGLKDKLSAMSLKETLTLLSTQGNLVKRPFGIDAENGIYLLGFREQEWIHALE